MSGTRRVTLKPGDLIYWEPGEDEVGITASVMMVSDEGTELLFQFATVPWSGMNINGKPGLNVEQAFDVLNGRATMEQHGLPGYLWKAYDAETDRAFVNPRLLEPGENL